VSVGQGHGERRELGVRLTEEDAGGGPDDAVNEHEQGDEAESGGRDGGEVGPL